MEARHVCKLCNKRFGCGRSLGGHMRSHLTNNLADFNDHEKQSRTSFQLGDYMEEGETDLESGNLSSFGYVLRKNPKKTQKLEFLSEECSHNDKFCRECGKGFESWKALFGHMKSHSCFEEVDDSLITDPKQKVVMDSQSDNEIEAPNKRKRSSSSRKRRTTTISNSDSSVSEVEQEQEVAFSLMLLSMDVGNWEIESSDTNSVSNGCDHHESLVKSNKFKGKTAVKKSTTTDKNQARFSSDMFLKPQKKTLAEFWDTKICKKTPKKRSKFECDICNKIFDSYQALGGHRASHKKLKGCLVESPIEEEIGSESSLEVAISETKLSNNVGRRDGEIGSRVSTKTSKHKCPICDRVFASGQALGGHKRSHLMNGSEAKNRESIRIEKQVPEIRGFLDLNLPPQPVVERESKDHNLESLKPWWVAANEHKHEALVNVGLHI